MRDTKLSGFMLRVGTHRKTYMIKVDISSGGTRRTVSEVIGHVGHITATKARADAQRRILELRHEALAPPAARVGPTLHEAYESYKVYLERQECAQDTFNAVRVAVELHLQDWLDLKLEKITRQMAIDRHNALTEKRIVHGKKMGGKYIANRTLGTLRTIFHHARKSHVRLTLEMEPTLGVIWHKEKRRQTGLGVEGLAAWHQELEENFKLKPIRRELHLLLLLSGSRPGALRSAQWKHVDFKGRALYFPRPKGGEERAFWIPLSRPMLDCLDRVKAAGALLYPKQSKLWIFPAESSTGHIIDHGERKTVLSKTGNDLRQTFKNMATLARVPKLYVMQLMNHRIPGDEVNDKPMSSDVSDGYLTETMHVLGDALRAAQDKISSFIMDALLKEKP